MHKKLTKDEAQRLKDYMEKHSGQVAVSVDFKVTPGTLSRTANRRTAPSPMLRDKLVEHGIIKA